MSISGQTFVQRLQSQSWYPGYAAALAAQGVPEWIADSIVADEDSSLQLTALGPDAPSMGIFQFIPSLHGMTVAQAEDPVYSATKFAAIAAQTLAAHPGDSDPVNVAQTMVDFENDGWPGLASSSIAQAELPNRIALAQQTISQLGLPGATAAQAAAVTSASGQTAAMQAAAASTAATPFGPSPIPLVSTAQWNEVCMGVVALCGIVLLIVVGIMLLGSGYRGPVPVPV